VAVVGEEADAYVLTPTDPAIQQALVAAAAADAAPVLAAPPVVAAVPVAPGGGVMVDSAAPATVASLAPPPVMLPPATAAEVAGNYAVLRQTRDTGCMVTLDAPGSHAEARAKLAPACRDQGIVIFDPAGWKLAKGQIVLMAKKGHAAVLTRQQDRTWATTPVKGPALVLKRL
jgi:hypothetical protein